MTRETRIGLLVAMAFIITFGLVLSELTGNSSPAGRRIRSALAQTKRPSWSPVIDRSPPAKIEPVVVGPTAGAPVSRSGATPVVLAAQGPVVSVDLIAPSPARPAATGRLELRRDTAAAGRTYTVQPNDSLRKIARKFYGQDNEDKYTEILAANRDEIEDEGWIVVGQELVIPPLAGRQPGSPEPAAMLANALPMVPPLGGTMTHRVMDTDQLENLFAVKPKAAEAKGSGRIYVARSGDNLTRIARRELNDDSYKTVMRIYEANRDKLPSPHMVPVGTKLRIPI